MKVITAEQTESVCDVVCDVCCAAMREGSGLQFGTLRASWGAGSVHDGERYEVHLCEPCFFRGLAGLKRDRMVNTMFSSGDEDLSNFGLVAREDIFNDGKNSSPWTTPAPVDISQPHNEARSKASGLTPPR